MMILYELSEWIIEEDEGTTYRVILYWVKLSDYQEELGYAN